MTFSAPTKPGKHVTSNIACAHSHRFTKYSDFWLALMTLCVMWHYLTSAFCWSIRHPFLKWYIKLKLFQQGPMYLLPAGIHKGQHCPGGVWVISPGPQLVSGHGTRPHSVEPSSQRHRRHSSGFHSVPCWK